MAEKVDKAAEALEAVQAFVKKIEDAKMLDSLFIGIDPGGTGAIGILCGRLCLVVDIPTIELQRKRTVKVRYTKKKPKKPGDPKTKTIIGKTNSFDLPGICRLFKALRPFRERINVAVEISTPQVFQGKKKGFGKKGFTGSNNLRTAWMVGIGYGMWPLFLTSKGYSLEEIQPLVWKKALALPKDKKAVLRKARSTWPKASLAREKDHNRAEALFLAHWLRRQRAIK